MCFIIALENSGNGCGTHACFGDRECCCSLGRSTAALDACVQCNSSPHHQACRYMYAASLAWYSKPLGEHVARAICSAATLRRSMRLIAKIVQTSNGAPRSPCRSTKSSRRCRHIHQHRKSHLKTKSRMFILLMLVQRHVTLCRMGVSASAPESSGARHRQLQLRD